MEFAIQCKETILNYSTVFKEIIKFRGNNGGVATFIFLEIDENYEKSLLKSKNINIDKSSNYEDNKNNKITEKNFEIVYLKENVKNFIGDKVFEEINKYYVNKEKNFENFSFFSEMSKIYSGNFLFLFLKKVKSN
jgi:hypothetical protein